MKVSIRPAKRTDLPVARGFYLETQRWVIEHYFGWEEAHEIAKFPEQFIPQNSYFIVNGAGVDIGWYQVRETADAVHLDGLYITGKYQRQGVGTQVMGEIMAIALKKNKPVVLGMAKINPAKALYDRLGFYVIAEEERKFHLRRDPAPI